MPPTSQTMAMNLRQYLYMSEPGAVYNAYPDGSRRPVTMLYTDAERAEHVKTRDRALDAWRKIDPEGHHAWHLATVAVQGGDDSPLREGWSAMIREEYGLKIVDPCAYCRECRR